MRRVALAPPIAQWPLDIFTQSLPTLAVVDASQPGDLPCVGLPMVPAGKGAICEIF